MTNELDNELLDILELEGESHWIPVREFTLVNLGTVDLMTTFNAF